MTLVYITLNYLILPLDSGWSRWWHLLTLQCDQGNTWCTCCQWVTGIEWYLQDIKLYFSYERWAEHVYVSSTSNPDVAKIWQWVLGCYHCFKDVFTVQRSTATHKKPMQKKKTDETFTQIHRIKNNTSVYTVLFVRAVDHCLCVSTCVADEVCSILLAEQGPFGSDRGQKRL